MKTKQTKIQTKSRRILKFLSLLFELQTVNKQIVRLSLYSFFYQLRVVERNLAIKRDHGFLFERDRLH